MPWTLNRMIGTKFRVVRGYADDTSLFIAAERGEIDGLGSTQYASLVRHPGWIEKNWVVPLYAIALERLPQLPNVPTIVELAGNDRDRAVMRILGTMPDLGFTIIAPPFVPQDRLDALRQAVAEMIRDPGFKSDMSKLDLDLDPLSGSDVAALVSNAMQAAPDTVRGAQGL